MRPPAVLLCVLAASWAMAADQPVPAAPAEAAAPAPAPAPAKPIWKRFVLRNPNAVLEVSTFRASVGKFALTKTHPTALPEWKRRQLDLPERNPDEPLAVLDLFRRQADMHGYLQGPGVSLDEDPGRGPFEGPWDVVEQDERHVILAIHFPASDCDYRMEYRLAETKPEVAVEFRITAGSHDVVVQPTLRALNGLHQDDPKLDGSYLTVATHRGGAEGSLATFRPSSAKAEQLDLGDGNGLDYVAIKDRFFAALWSPRGCTLARAEGNAAAPPPRSLTADPLAQSAAPTAAAADCSLRLSTEGFVDDRSGAQQALVRAVWSDPRGMPITLKPKDRLTLNWTMAITSMKKSDLALFTDAEQQIQYTEGYYKFFKSLAKLLTIALEAIAVVVRNYGVALIVLTFLLKLALHRFTVKQMTSMMKMQKLAPQLKYLQEQFKNDRQQLATKQMEMYKKHGVNPLGGCLPMFVQIPVFIALYQAFLHSAEMRGQAFLWIPDLTMPDQVWGFPNPYLSWLTINPLPIVYIAATVWMSFSQKMPSGGDPTQEQTAKMMRWMPVVFGLIFYNMSSGLVLYFTTNAILSTIETRMVRRRLGMDQPAVPVASAP